MDMAAWNPHTMSEPLINVVRKYPALWDFTLPSNKNKNLKETLWKQVTNEIKWPESDYQTVSGKWANLRTTWQRERNKMLKGLPSGSGANYVSQWAYFAVMDEFLSKPDPHHTITISNIPVPLPPVSIPLGASEDCEIQMVNLPVSTANSSASMPLGTSAFPAMFDDVQMMPSNNTPKKRRGAKKTKTEPSNEDAMIQQAISALESSTNSYERKLIDEMTAFGDFVGSALRGMEERKAHEAQCQILEIIQAKRY